MRQTHGRLALVLALAVAIASVPMLAPAAEQRTKGLAQGAEEGAAAAPLKGEIRLSPGAQRGMGSSRLGVRHAVSFKGLNQKFDDFSGNAKTYEQGAKKIPEIAKACANKSYSIQDQKAAGCTGNETMNQCMDKLYKHCIETFSVSGFDFPTPKGGHIPGFSTKQFQETAHAASAQARELSQLLNQYANEVDQNAKALVP